MKRTQTRILIGVMLVASAAPTSFAEQLPTQAADTSSGYVTRTHEPGNRSALPYGAADTFAFARLDTNRNFSISRSEADESETLKAVFDQVDQNHDLQITPSEFSAFETAKMRAEQKSQSVTAQDEDITSTQAHSEQQSSEQAAQPTGKGEPKQP